MHPDVVIWAKTKGHVICVLDRSNLEMKNNIPDHVILTLHVFVLMMRSRPSKSRKFKSLSLYDVSLHVC